MRTSLNILISSAGRQTSLVKEFQDALGNNGLVFTSDINPKAKALQLADNGFMAPAYHHKSFIPWMISLCKTEEIKLLVSLNVDELLILEPNRKSFSEIGCNLVGGPIESIQITYDKYALFNFCKKLRLPAIATWLKNEVLNLPKIHFPLIAKKRFGKGSRGQYKIMNKQELFMFCNKNGNNSPEEDYIFQEYINGVEFGFDLVNDFHGKFQAILARRKYAMKNGETNKAVTENPEKWKFFGETLSENLKHQGTIDMDVIVFKEQAFLLDINFRFGGGYAFSHLAGAHIPKAYVSWALGKPIDQGWLKPKEGIMGQRTSFGVIKKPKL